MQEKTRKRLVWNKEFQMHQWEEYKTGKYTFTEDDKIAIVSEYIAGHIPASQIIEKYHISSRQVLFNWMDKYVNEKELVPLSGQTNSSNTMASKSPARITCTAILIAWGYCPISFRTVDSIDYKKAMLLFYEQNNIVAIKQIFIEQYEFAVKNYF